MATVDINNQPDKVVPGKPEDSQLWQLVHDDEMPPEDARTGPLPKEQKQIIHDWIAAGAPSVSSEPPAAPAPTPPSVEHAPTLSAEKRFLCWLGKFHVIVVHFPSHFYWPQRPVRWGPSGGALDSRPPLSTSAFCWRRSAPMTGGSRPPPLARAHSVAERGFDLDVLA